MIEDKELFFKSIRDIMIPALSVVGFLLITIVLCMLWMPFLLIMSVIGGGLVISFISYKERLAQKKRDERDKQRYGNYR
jgi:amino acid transporter